jgi:hypothetical protein
MRRLLLAALFFSAIAAPAFARSSQDRVGIGNDITVAEGETASDIACVFCSVHIHGEVKGDIAVLFGQITIDDNQRVSGDIAGLGTDLRLGEDATVGGDVALVAGDTNLAPSATIRGDRMVLPGRLWLLLPFAPLLILIGIIWLIVYVVQRNRYQFPAYPNGRGFQARPLPPRR